MGDGFIRRLIQDHSEVEDAVWQSDSIIEIKRKNHAPFNAAIIKEKLVEAKHIQPFLNSPASIIVNFPKIGKWDGDAILRCERHGKAWGQWGVLMRAINSESPERTENPEIYYSYRAIRQHTRVESVSFILDHLLLVNHENGKQLKVALLYQYDLCGDDVRRAWDDLGEFDVLLKTNPNGSILEDADEVANALGIKAFSLKGLFAYLAKGKF